MIKGNDWRKRDKKSKKESKKLLNKKKKDKRELKNACNEKLKDKEYYKNKRMLEKRLKKNNKGNGKKE